MDLEGRFPAEFERILNLIQTPFLKKVGFRAIFLFAFLVAVSVAVPLVFCCF